MSAAIVRGTEWLTEVRCDGTLVQVSEGVVEVRDFVAPAHRPGPRRPELFRARAVRSSRPSRCSASVLVMTGAALLIGLTPATDSAELRTVDWRFEVRGTQPPPDDVVDGADRCARPTSELQVPWPFDRTHARQGHRLARRRRREGDRLRRAVHRTVAPDAGRRPRGQRADRRGAPDRADGPCSPPASSASAGKRNISAAMRRSRQSEPCRSHADAAGLRRHDPARAPGGPTGCRASPWAQPRSRAADRCRARTFDADGNGVDRLRRPARDDPDGLVLRRSTTGARTPRCSAGPSSSSARSAAEVQDVHPTTTSRDGQMSGAEIHANAIATLLDDAPLRAAPGWLTPALTVLFGLLVPLADDLLRR